MERVIIRNRNTFFFFLYQAIVSMSFGVADQQHAHQVRPHQVYFRGQGTIPAWTLTIADNQVTFESDSAGYDLLSFVHTEPTKEENGQVRHYVFSAEPYAMDVRIYEMLCENEGSRERFPYAVDVQIKPGNGTCTKFSGCGLYVTDGNLRGRWEIIKVKNDSVRQMGIADKTPFLQIDPSGNSFQGYTGCNDISGRIFAARNLFRFTDFVKGKTICDPNLLEASIVRALQFTTQYELNGDLLILSNPTSQTLTLKKIE